MTTNYNRSQVYEASLLSETAKAKVLDTYGFDNSDFYSTSFVKFTPKEREAEFLPLAMFTRTERLNKFTHAVYSTSAFDGYFLTFNRSNGECVVAHKCF